MAKEGVYTSLSEVWFANSRIPGFRNLGILSLRTLFTRNKTASEEQQFFLPPYVYLLANKY